MKHQNKGEVSFYICAMLLVLLPLILAVLQGVRIWEGKAKCRQAVSGMVASIKGDYQPDLFRRYHLLAIDETYYGRGEGYMEARAEDYLAYNLASGNHLYQYEIETVSLGERRYLTEDHLEGFRAQIEEDMKLRFPILAAETIFGAYGQKEQDTLLAQQEEDGQLAGLTSGENTDWTSERLTQENIESMGLTEALEEQGISEYETLTLDELLSMNLSEQGLLTDPRQVLEELGGQDILSVILPEKAGSISRVSISRTNLPSGSCAASDTIWNRLEGLSGITDISDWLNTDWQSPELELGNGLEQDLYGIAYALDCFQYAGKEDTEAYHACTYEVEYLIAGQDSDYENLSEVAERLCMLRMIPNAAYAFSNETMQKEAEAVATLLLAPVGLAEFGKPVSYVLLGCWAYGESLLDVRLLLLGEQVPLFKDQDSWHLSLNGLANLAETEASGETEGKDGLTYGNYLAVLLAASSDSDAMYARMLDIMQLNIQNDIPEFEIEHCVWEFSVQTEIQEGNRIWRMEETGSYQAE